MQTFLPYPDFQKTVKVLDYRRLGKQRVEAYQILRTLRGEGKTGWKHHPAVLMWKGYEKSLAAYMNACIEEWIDRGYRNTMRTEFVGFPAPMPPWFGAETLHASHRSNLLRKDPVYYGAFGWAEGPHLPYYWPVTKDGTI